MCPYPTHINKHTPDFNNTKTIQFKKEKKSKKILRNDLN